MSDIIKLLPDSIANQIAAGEVIQRPASVIKELMENAVDAGSESIKVILKDSGKTLIQVVDNGKGMSETDARMCFERHATSKIKNANDLFSIKTMGFRGEAMASIAAIAHVELQTQEKDAELGTRILIKGSSLDKQETISINPGTSISVKNLFFNVPARRKFLKSDAVELKHVLEEFHRVALANPAIFFSLHHNKNEIYHLPVSNTRQRIVNVFGKNQNEKLIPVDQQMELININGFVGKPEASRKTKGDQYIFVNQRFIKSNYLNHAIRTAYEELIAKDLYPFYVLYIEMDPSQIDINVHPTKTEIKFEDERLIYNYVRVAIKHSLGRYTVAPSLDFDQEIGMVQMYSGVPKKNKPNSYSSGPPKDDTSNWESVYSALQNPKDSPNEQSIIIESGIRENFESQSTADQFGKKPYQIHGSFIVSQIKSGYVLIDQQSAHERILYERYLEALANSKPLSQKQLFPKTIELSVIQKGIADKILDQINCLGFEIEDFGNNSLIVHGIPVGLSPSEDIQEILEKLIDQYSENLELQLGLHENLSRAMALSSSIKKGHRMTEEEMVNLIDELFACSIPSKSPSGKKCFISYDLDELIKQFAS